MGVRTGGVRASGSVEVQRALPPEAAASGAGG